MIILIVRSIACYGRQWNIWCRLNFLNIFTCQDMLSKTRLMVLWDLKFCQPVQNVWFFYLIGQIIDSLPMAGDMQFVLTYFLIISSSWFSICNFLVLVVLLVVEHNLCTSLRLLYSCFDHNEAWFTGLCRCFYL